MKKFLKDPIPNIDYIVDYYEILGLDPQSPELDQELKKAYHQRTKENHPDKFEHASEKIKLSVNRTFRLIQEAYSVLKDPELKNNYDQQLQLFRKERPELISKDGIPIIDVSAESFNVDYLLSGLEWDFQKSMREKVKFLSGYNPTVFNLIESQYLNDPMNEELKEAYLDQLAHKNAHLSLEEDFCWQNAGVLNFKQPKLISHDDYLVKIEERIKSLKNDSKKSIQLRLMSAQNNPILLEGQVLDQQIDHGQALVLISDKVNQKISEQEGIIRKAAEEKALNTAKMAKIRTYSKVKIVDGSSTQVFLYQDGKILVGFYCDPQDNGNAEINMLEDYRGTEVSQLDLDSLVRTTILLKNNSELELVTQIYDFFNDYFNDKL